MNLTTSSLSFFIFLAIFFANSDSLTFTPETHNSGLIFIKLSQARVSYDSYNMVYHIELSEYFKIRDIIEGSLTELTKLCKRVAESSCISLTHEIKIQLNFMLRDELDIRTYQQKLSNKTHSRSKRSWNWPGSVLHWAFGVMDADTAEAYDSKINEIINETSRIHNDIRDQTIFIKEFIDLNNNTQTELSIQFTKINQKLNSYIKSTNDKVKSQIEKTAFNHAAQEMITILLLRIMEHQRLSNQILGSLKNTASGQTLQLIPITTLIKDLLTSSNSLSVSQMFPIDFRTENSLHIFEHAKIRVSLFGTRLLIEIVLPIVERQSYTVYEIIPIPILFNNTTVIINPTTSLVLINNNGIEYIPLPPSEYEHAKTNSKNEKIIKPSKNSQLDYTQSCELTIFMNPRKEIIQNLCDIKIIPTANYFISLNNNNLFFVTIVKPTIITEYCDGKSIQTHDITTNGKLSISCRITTNQISIRPRSTIKFESDEIIVLSNRTNSLTMNTLSEILNTQNITFTEFEDDILVKDYSIDYSKLIDKADKFIEKKNIESKIEEIHYDQVNRSYFIYWLIGIAIVTIIFCGLALVAYLYLKFYNINTWEGLASKLTNKGVDHRMPTLFLRNRPEPSAPFLNTYNEPSNFA